MTDENDRRLSANGLLSSRSIIAKNFIGGISWGVGSAIGATIVVAILVLVLKTVRLAPVIGDFVSSVIEVVEQNQINSVRPSPPSSSN